MQAAPHRLRSKRPVRSRAFAEGGCDVAANDALEPDACELDVKPELAELSWKLVIFLPTLKETLAPSRPAREA